MQLQFQQVLRRTYVVANNTISVKIGNFNSKVLVIDISAIPAPQIYHFNIGWIWAEIPGIGTRAVWSNSYKILNKNARLCVFPFDNFGLIFCPKIYYSDTSEFQITVNRCTNELTTEEINLLKG